MAKSKTIIEELQLEAADPNVSVSSLLRKAKIIATKLDLSDFLEWIDQELNGYTEIISKELPKYRQCYGEPKAFNPYHGWQPVMFENTETREAFSYAPIGQPIGPLEEMVAKDKENSKTGSLEFKYPPAMKQRIIDSLEFPTDVKLMLSLSIAHGILDAVRNSILDWALKLEKAGVTGDGLNFSEKEKTEAKPATQQIFAQNIGSIGNMYDQASINNQTASLNFDSKIIENTLNEIEKNAHLLPDDIQDQVAQQAKLAKQELQKEDGDKSKISAALTSIKNICEGASGSVIGQGIISLIEKIPF